jgi:hypothetical protein
MFLIKLFYCSQELEDHTHEVTLQTEVLDGMFTFYDSTRASLNVYQVLVLFFILLLREYGAHFYSDIFGLVLYILCKTMGWSRNFKALD